MELANKKLNRFQARVNDNENHESPGFGIDC